MKVLKSEKGLTLIELMISIAIISLIAGVFAQMVGGALESWRYGNEKSELVSTARLTMERMVSKVRNTTWVLLPLKISDPDDPGYPASSYFPRDILAVSGNIDNDEDGLVDEDPGNDLTGDNLPGIMLIDDDDDGIVDEIGQIHDDDEDLYGNDEWMNGIDDDDDGRIDEDFNTSFYGNSNDDDKDGVNSEDPFDPLIYYLNGTTLMERQNVLTATVSDNVIAENVSQFIVIRRHVDGNTLIDIYLKLDDGNNEVELRTTAMALRKFKP